MKVQLEKPCKNRGIILEAETDEDRDVLLELWTRKGRSVMLDYRRGKVKSLVIAPAGQKYKGGTE